MGAKPRSSRSGPWQEVEFLQLVRSDDEVLVRMQKVLCRSKTNHSRVGLPLADTRIATTAAFLWGMEVTRGAR
jgi:hypothetical protein